MASKPLAPNKFVSSRRIVLSEVETAMLRLALRSHATNMIKSEGQLGPRDYRILADRLDPYVRVAIESAKSDEPNQ